jgi:hypothetical protein
MNKTQTALLQRIDESSHKLTTVIHGYRTRCKNGSFGTREFNAMIALRDAGVIEITKTERYQNCGRHYTENWSECVIRRSLSA